MNWKAFIMVAVIALCHTQAWADKGGTLAERNRLKERATQAYESGNYAEAAVHLSMLVDSLKVNDPKLTYDLAYSQMRSDKMEDAARNFTSLVTTENREIRSLAEQQLGIIAAQGKKLEEAISHFKNSLRADPSNENSRYNYELLKKEQDKKEQEKGDKKEEKEEKEKQDKKDQDKKDSQEKGDKENKEEGDKGEEKDGDKKDGKDKEGKQDQEKKDSQDKGDKKEGEKKEEGEKGEKKEQEENKEKQPQPGEEKKDGEKEGEGQPQPQQFQEIDIPEEKAKMILEALRNREAQYLQQRQRKSDKPRNSDRPDW